jgi:ankyrin repeat protein
MDRRRSWTVAAIGLVTLAIGSFVLLRPAQEPQPASATVSSPGQARSPPANANGAFEATPGASEPANPGQSNFATLPEAVAAGDVEGVRRLLEDGASPDAYYLDGTSAIAHAIVDQHSEIVDLLLEAGATVDTSPGTEPLLAMALRNGDDTLALDLLQRGAPVVASDGESPLVTAIAQGANDDLIGALLVAGADVNAADGNGETPLTAAIATGNAELVAQLLHGGARADVVRADDMTPLQLAMDANEAEIADLLRQAGATE